MKTNYTAWQIDKEVFSESWDDLQKLTFFARFAVLAPSGHNTQPWRFKVSGRSLILLTDYNRRLPYSGLQANEPYVSLGACLGTFQLAAQGFGYTTNVTYVLQDETIATIQLGDRTSSDPTLLDAIKHRVSNRTPYDKTPLPGALLTEITASGLADVETHVLSERDDITYVGELTTEATLRVMGDKQFRGELSKWVRNNLTRQHDGMPGFVQEIPTPVSMLAKHVIKNVNISKDQARKDSGRIVASANLAILAVKDLSPHAMIDGGSAYAQLCVRAQQQGIATAGVGTAIIDPETTRKIKDKYNITGKPIAIIRLGKATKPAKHSPRWPLDEIYSK